MVHILGVYFYLIVVKYISLKTFLFRYLQNQEVNVFSKSIIDMKLFYNYKISAIKIVVHFFCFITLLNFLKVYIIDNVFGPRRSEAFN